MIVLRFLHDTPFDLFEGTFKLARDCYGDVAVRYDAETGHLVVKIFTSLMTAEEVENDLAKYSHWFTAEAVE